MDKMWNWCVQADLQSGGEKKKKENTTQAGNESNFPHSPRKPEKSHHHLFAFMSGNCLETEVCMVRAGHTP